MSDYFSRRERVSLDGTDKEGSPYANTWEHALAQVTGKWVSGMWAWGRTCGVHGLWDKQVPNRKCHESLNGACLWISLNPQGLYQVYMPTSPMLLPWVVRMHPPFPTFSKSPTAVLFDAETSYEDGHVSPTLVGVPWWALTTKQLAVVWDEHAVAHGSLQSTTLHGKRGRKMGCNNNEKPSQDRHVL